MNTWKCITGEFRSSGFVVVLMFVFGTVSSAQQSVPPQVKQRVIISTDIGGSDPDDFQSMVHLLVYSDCLDIEGLISSPFGKGRKKHILDVIDCYEKDYRNLKSYSSAYPTPEALRAITKQGETEIAPYSGTRKTTEGSRWIIKRARRNDSRPLHVLVWGGIEDLAQALADAPDILPKLRVYYIGGPNKKWAPHAYQYVATHHKELWIIESNSTYRGWFTGGDQSAEWENSEFVRRHIAGHGALGDFFCSKLEKIKMGDSPSVGWLLHGTPSDPTQPSWGGRFVPAGDRPFFRFERITTSADQMTVFGILELVLPLGNDAPEIPEGLLLVENQKLPGFCLGDGTIRFRFCPKAKRSYQFTIRSNDPSLNGKTGGINAVGSNKAILRKPRKHPNWWTDHPAPELAEGAHAGAKSVNRWRPNYLRDFAERMDRCSRVK